MFVYLSEPYPDELLYSVVARYLANMMSRHTARIIRTIFGGNNRECSVFLPIGLSIVADRTWPIWTMNGRDIANELTMYPYYVAFLSADLKEKIMDALLSRNWSKIFPHLGRYIPKTLKFCPRCRAADLLEYNETYWRRSHQMKGIVVCPEHGEELAETMIPRDCKGANFLEATEATSIGVKPNLLLTDKERDLALSIARRCQKVLKGQIEPQWSDVSPTLYRSIAMEKGLYSTPKGDMSRLIKTFEEMYSTNLLAATGLALPSHSTWLREIFNSHGSDTFQPVVHVIIQDFLSEAPEFKPDSASFGAGPWKCPNPFSDHNDPLPIKAVKVKRIRGTGKLIARARCCCGYYFSFTTTTPVNKSIPVVYKVDQYGPTWQKEIKRMLDAGINPKTISETLNITLSDLNFIMGRSRSQIFLKTLRMQWSDLLKHTEHHSIIEARELNPYLYKKLKRNDPCFVYISLGSTGRERNYSSSDYWVELDNSLSVQLKEAVLSILAIAPPVWVTATAIIKRCNASNQFKFHRERLPKSEQVLQKMSESVEAFQKRRLSYVAEKAKEQGISLKLNQLLRNAGIRREKYKQNLKDHADSLL